MEDMALHFARICYSSLEQGRSVLKPWITALVYTEAPRTFSQLRIVPGNSFMIAATHPSASLFAATLSGVVIPSRHCSRPSAILTTPLTPQDQGYPTLTLQALAQLVWVLPPHLPVNIFGQTILVSFLG